MLCTIMISDQEQAMQCTKLPAYMQQLVEVVNLSHCIDYEFAVRARDSPSLHDVIKIEATLVF